MLQILRRRARMPEVEDQALAIEANGKAERFIQTSLR
jgi:hypothetical protein